MRLELDVSLAGKAGATVRAATSGSPLETGSSASTKHEINHGQLVAAPVRQGPESRQCSCNANYT